MEKRQYIQPQAHFYAITPHVMHTASVQDFEEKTETIIGDDDEE